MRASRMTSCAGDGPLASSDRQATIIRHMTRLLVARSYRWIPMSADLPETAPARGHRGHCPARGAGDVRTFTDVILPREVVVCATILLADARYDPADLKPPRG
ncbi:hypothetical protein BwSH20_25350 [Bradyrhizobium ottawaense]|nr:hypothetical protein BwSF12_53730 [Bradyrhizobium ottawaense]GMO68484.1 hypothetical protein BwSG20_30970 [Bradyrhizobium ottawaense]GMO99417.1 hypothetical protein BwSH20_25350 [Bradyrhizobium ottawaense]